MSQQRNWKVTTISYKHVETLKRLKCPNAYNEVVVSTKFHIVTVFLKNLVMVLDRLMYMSNFVAYVMLQMRQAIVKYFLCSFSCSFSLAFLQSFHFAVTQAWNNQKKNKTLWRLNVYSCVQPCSNWFQLSRTVAETPPVGIAKKHYNFKKRLWRSHINKNGIKWGKQV